MTQTSLDTTGKIILDATCSYARIYPKFATIRIDIRPQTKPDIVMDAKDLKFIDNYFDEIYCDPPHLLRKGPHKTEAQKRRLLGRKSPGFWERYGYWESKDKWNDFIEKTNNEFYRVLKPNGLLYYKITESPIIEYDDFITMMVNFKLINDLEQKSKSNLKWEKPKSKLVHFLTFMSKKQK